MYKVNFLLCFALLLCLLKQQVQGACVNGFTTKSFQCTCYQGYSGDDCSQLDSPCPEKRGLLLANNTTTSAVARKRISTTSQCVGTCGSGTANGVVAAPPDGASSYNFITTTNGVMLAGFLDSAGQTDENTGSRFTSATFRANVGAQLVFYFNYVTTDGSGFADYAWARLERDGIDSALIFTARTKPSGAIVPGVGLPPIVATLTPSSVPIIPGAPSWQELGGSGCYSAGCGSTGWVKSEYTIPQRGLYEITFGVTNAIDGSFNSGLAFTGVLIDGTDITTLGVTPPTVAAAAIPAVSARMELGNFLFTVNVARNGNRGPTFIFFDKQKSVDSICNFVSQSSTGSWQRATDCIGDTYVGSFTDSDLKNMCGVQFVETQNQYEIYSGVLIVKWFDHATVEAEDWLVPFVQNYRVTTQDGPDGSHIVGYEDGNIFTKFKGYTKIGNTVQMVFSAAANYKILPESLWIGFNNLAEKRSTTAWAIGPDQLSASSQQCTGEISASNPCTIDYTVVLNNQSPKICNLDGQWTLKYALECTSDCGTVDTSKVYESNLAFSDFVLDPICAPECSDHGILEGSYCNCYSGYAPADTEVQQDCDLTVAAECDWHITAKLDTTAEENPVLVHVEMADGMLALSASSAVSLNSTVAYINFENGNSDCAYPGPKWHKEVHDCEDVYIFHATWDAAVNCGFDQSEDDDYYLFSARLFITHSDFNGYLLEEIATYRNLTSTSNIQIRFLKSIEIQTDITIFSPIATEAALIQQQYTPDVAQAEIVLETVVQYPYRLSNVSIVTPSGFSGPQAELIEEDCSATAYAFCNQKWRATFSPPACRFTGTYTWDFVVECSNTTICPVDDETNSASIVVNLISEDFCATTSDDVNFEASLNSYGDGDFSSAQYYFLQNATAYFMAEVHSDDGDIVSTWISDVIFEDAGTEYNLFEEEVATTLGNDASFSTDVGTNSATFSFKLLHTLAVVPSIQSKSFTVTATVHAQFKNNQVDKRTVTFQSADSFSSSVHSGLIVSNSMSGEVAQQGVMKKETNITAFYATPYFAILCAIAVGMAVIASIVKHYKH